MPLPSKRICRAFASLLLTFLAAAFMLRSFAFWEQWTLIRPHSASSLQSSDGLLIFRYLSTTQTLQPLGYSHNASSLHAISFSLFEDQTFFMSHFTRSSDGFDCELLGLRLTRSSTNERYLLSLQFPDWIPVAALSLLAFAGLLRRAAKLLLPRPSPGFTPLPSPAATAAVVNAA
jgi:hypothetical protein